MPSYKIRLSIVGPMMATGLEGRDYGIDAPFLRDADGKRFVFPGTQLKGVLRQILGAMSDAAPERLERKLLEKMFGTASGSSTATKFDADPSRWAPNAGHILVTDLVAADRPDHAEHTMTRIAVDDFTGSVREGHLQVLEQPVGIGETLTFEGTISLTVDQETADACIAWIGEALKLLPAIGANKSAGFGRLAATPTLEPLATEEPSPAVDQDRIAALAASPAVNVSLRFDGPFLISAERWNSNLISGQTRVPGAAFKAVIAQMLGADQEDHPLHHALSRVVMRELRPAKPDAARPITAPLSHFVALEGRSFSIGNGFDDDPEDYVVELGAETIAFLPDVKTDSDAFASLKAQLHETFEPERQVRTRTAISSKGVAETGQLFTYSAVKPNGFVWTGTLLRGAATAEEFAALLKAIPSRIEGFGKTRVGASIELGSANLPDQTAPVGRVRIVLETPACLHAPRDFLAFAEEVDPAERLRLQYQAYFADALRQMANGAPATFADADLELRFFATQFRIGGYLAARYPIADDGYQPWVLTSPGSAFEFSIPVGLEKSFIRLLELGLPVPSGLTEARRTWRGNPFVPENGYGEIRLMGKV